jgi:hypothetical protein
LWQCAPKKLVSEQEASKLERKYSKTVQELFKEAETRLAWQKTASKEKVDAWKASIIKSNSERILSAESRAKISQALTGRKRSEDAIARHKETFKKSAAVAKAAGVLFGNQKRVGEKYGVTKSKGVKWTEESKALRAETFKTDKAAAEAAGIPFGNQKRAGVKFTEDQKTRRAETIKKNRAAAEEAGVPYGPLKNSGKGIKKGSRASRGLEPLKRRSEKKSDSDEGSLLPDTLVPEKRRNTEIEDAPGTFAKKWKATEVAGDIVDLT